MIRAGMRRIKLTGEVEDRQFCSRDDVNREKRQMATSCDLPRSATQDAPTRGSDATPFNHAHSTSPSPALRRSTPISLQPQYTQLAKMWGISYWVFPVISGLCWLGMLLGLLIRWTSDGEPWYPSMDPGQTIAYISDIGAQSLKPLFIAGSCVTTVFLDLSFLSERWLRHQGRLARNTSLFQKILSWLSIAFALLGTCGLILLSIFDTLRHPTLHDVFLLLFIIGYVVSAIFICWEYQRLGIHFRQHKILRLSFWIKLSFILIEVVLAIAFGVTNFKKTYNAAAVLEWSIAFIFIFYVFSFFIDLLPAVRTKSKDHRFGDGEAETELQMEQNDAYANGRVTADSQRTLGANDARTVNGVKYEEEGGRRAPLASNF
ncbi:hypothetical protein G7Y89_g7111 [Cudoniella acicularis]|uniref:CWH43-like N-terminal domain-containing protein n=1 Tax=Cudoniella acicularis TaxID=354080 RepID=A0A8H4RK01_9HELO|nr:hypothetical protein G7Y89_g7111 [Cudoniella acicularis]